MVEAPEMLELSVDEAASNLDVTLSNDRRGRIIVSAWPPISGAEVSLLWGIPLPEGVSLTARTTGGEYELQIGQGSIGEAENTTALTIAKTLAQHREVATARVELYKGVYGLSKPHTTLLVRQ